MQNKTLQAENILQELSLSRREGRPLGIYSVCSAHPLVVEAAARQAVEDGSSLLVEATSNQVNQEGGYTGMTPERFRDFVLKIASGQGLAAERLLLGGDHLGPNPWQNLPAVKAMELAEEMVAAYARAGFCKIHLDASMSCADDPTPLSTEVIAERAARLCLAAESNRRGQRPSYIIGTEVPVPGGATESLAELAVTRREDAENTVRIHESLFAQKGLGSVWPRVIALVVQPGVEFNHEGVVNYRHSRTTELRKVLATFPGLVFEAHSTDYQAPESYRQLVDDGFAILKVGPALTFAMREALFALARIEEELLPIGLRSHLIETVEEAMLESPGYWLKHYHGDRITQHLLRTYSYSDRVRYYWNAPAVSQAAERLMNNLEGKHIPETLLSSFLPQQYQAVRAGKVKDTAHELVIDRIREAIRPYAAACLPA